MFESKYHSTTLLPALLTGITLLSSSLAAQYGTSFGSACQGKPTLSQIGPSRAAGQLDLQVISQNTNVPAILAFGVQLFPSPVPLLGCDIYFSPLALVGVNKNSAGVADLRIPLPATLTQDIRAYVHALENDPGFPTVSFSRPLQVDILATPPQISGISTSTLSTGQSFTIQGVFRNNPTDFCVGLPGGGLGIVESGQGGQLVVRAEAGAANVSGPIELLAGKRDRVSKNALPNIPGFPTPSDISVFSGTPIAANMTVSRQPVRVVQDTRLKPFSYSAASKTITHKFGSGCQKGDRVRVFMRIYENGKCHDVYFLEDGKFAGKTLDIPVTMSGNACANWLCLWLTQSLSGRIPGFQCNVVGDELQITVTNGTGITGSSGGFWIE